jgi:predicted dienelactone hydrolase
MTARKCASLIGALLVAVVAVANCGCGGGNGAAAFCCISVSVAPTTATVLPGATAQFTATVNNDPRNAGVTWNVVCAPAGMSNQQISSGCGSLSTPATPSGTQVTYTAPTSGDLVVTIQAFPVTEGAVFASATATVTVPGIGVSISSPNATVNLGATGQFTAAVTNDSSNKGVNWTVSCSAASCGSVSPTMTASGAATTYTAPTTPFAGGLGVTLTATSVANTTASAQAFITVSGVNVSVAPSTASLQAAATQQFSATVSNDSTNSGVNWSLTQNGTSCSPGCGTIAPSTTLSGSPSIYTAPPTPPASNTKVTVTATSVALLAASGSATATVLAITVSVSPISALLPKGITQPFNATVNNDPANAGVTWTLTQNGTACTATTCGTLSSTTANAVTYNAPAAISASSVVTLSATSVTDTTKSAAAAINLATGTVEIVPDSLDFGRALVGKTVGPETVTLTNTGTAALNIISITTAGANAGDFSQTNTCGSSVGAAMSCPISVTFKPGARGSFTANVSVTDGSTDSPQQVSLTGTGFTNNKGVASVRSALTGTTTAAAPTPTGPYTVGTRVMNLTDPTRNDPYLANGTPRELAVRFWYPASLNQECKSAEYTYPAVWEYFSQLVNVHPFQVTTNSCLNAPVSDGAHPIVVFTPGYTATFTDYTFLLEDLASRGYIVASVAHTYETTAVELPDRGLVKGLFGSHLDGTWRGDEQTFSFATSVRLQDLTFVLNELQQLNIQPADPFEGKLDISRVAIAGHSMGGSTAILAVEQESRYKAGIVIDGIFPHAFPASTETPVLLLAAGRDQWSAVERRVWGLLQGARFAVNLRGAEHVTPTDEVWLAKDVISTGPMGPEKTIAAIRDYIAAFLDTNLQGQSVHPLLTGSSSEYPDAEVTTQNQLLRGKP